MSGNKSAGGAFLPNADYDITGDWTHAGAETFSGAVTMTGAVTQSGAVSQSGAQTFTAAVSMSSAVTMTGAVSMSSAVTMSGTVTQSSQVISFVEAGSSSGGNLLKSFGTSTINCSTGSLGTVAYTLPGPVTGYKKNIACLYGSTSQGNATVTITSGTFNAAGTVATFSTAGSLQLVGASNAAWAVVSATNVTFS